MLEPDEDYADALERAALGYVAAGLYVFPARVERPDPASHSKRSQFIGQWKRAATRDAVQVRAWWGPGGSWRGAHICIDMGGSGLVGLDADGADGVAALEAVSVEHGWDPPIAVAGTPSGGQHWIYRENYRRPVSIDSDGKLAPGVDVRGMGGLLFAAPSRDSAGAYRWVGESDWAGQNVVPDLVVERMKAPVTSEGSPGSPLADRGEPSGEPAPFDTPARQFTRHEAIDFCAPHLAALRAAPVGTINSRLNDAAKALSHFVPAFWSQVDASAWLDNALAATEYDGKTWRAPDTIASAFRSAANDWRAELVADPFGQDQLGPGPAPEPSLVDALDAEFLTPDQVVDRPPPTPLILDWLDLDSLAWLIGKPGSYKSFLVLDWAAHIGAGLPWRGHRVEQGDVDYIVAEGVTGMSLRVRAWQERHGPMKGVRFLPRPVQASGPEWAVLVEVERRRKPKLVILDTQARVTVGMDENDNTEMGQFIHRAEQIRQATGACVLIVHHIGRNGEDARGASALDGAQSTEIKIKRSDRGPLFAVIEQDKQKDMAEAEPVEVELGLVELGIDGQTGRRLSSLVLAPVDPFETAGLARVRDWIDNLPDNQAEVVGVLADLFTEHGATKAEAAAAVRERRVDSGRPPMAKGSFFKVWDALAAKGILVKIRGSQRFILDTESNDISMDMGSP